MSKFKINHFVLLPHSIDGNKYRNARTNKSLNLSFAEIEKIAEGELNDVNRKKKDYGETVHCILSGKASFNPDGKFRTPSGMLLSGKPNYGVKNKTYKTLFSQTTKKHILTL